jgi:hypothetical protein
MHTFDYRGDAVHVYRVEDTDGYGPWSNSRHSKQWMWDSHVYGEGDPGGYLPSHDMSSRTMRFGFINAQQMIEAFAPTMLGRAFTTGNWHVAVYETCEEAVREMDEYQITFDITQAKMVKRIASVQELHYVLKTSAYNCQVRTFDARGPSPRSDVRVSDSAATAFYGPGSYEERRQRADREPLLMGMES